MKRLLVLSLVGACALGLAFGVASADVITIHFNGTDGVSSALWWSNVLTGNGGTNTGGEPGVVKLSMKNVDWYFPAALFRANLPANLSGATINSATFRVKETWYNDNLTHVQLCRIDSPAPWNAGTGQASLRWGRRNLGVQRLFANYDNVLNTGVNWAGATVDWATGTAAGTRTEFDTVVGAVIDTENCIAGVRTAFDVKTLVQHWADGSWNNDGLVLWMGGGASGTTTQELRTTANFDLPNQPTGLTIDYTPAIPEPATMLLVGTGLVGLLGMLRRRRMR